MVLCHRVKKVISKIGVARMVVVGNTIDLYRVIKNSIRVFGILIVIFLVAISNHAYCANLEPKSIAENKVKNILIINSPHVDESTDEEGVGFLVDELKENYDNIKISIIRLDKIEDNNGKNKVEKIQDVLQQHPKGYYDLIIAKGDQALRSVCNIGMNVFDDAPLISYDISKYNKKDYPNSFGIISNMLLKNNLELASAIFPETEYLAVATNNSVASLESMKNIQDELAKKLGLFVISLNVDELTKVQLQTKIKNLPNNTVVFIDSWNSEISERNGKLQVLKELLSSPTIPVFTNKPLYIKLGALGGVLQDSGSISKVISGSIARSILFEDRSASEIKISVADNGKTSLNWHTMTRFKGNYQDLKAGIDYYGRPNSDLYKEKRLNKTLNILYRQEPPFISKNVNGKLEGSLVDVWNLWAHKADKNIRFIDSSKNNNIQDLGVNSVQVGVSKIITDDSEMYGQGEIYPILLSTASIYYDRLSHAEYSWKGYRNSRIAIVKNKSFEDFLTKNVPNATVVIYDNCCDVVKGLDSGEFDVFFMEDIVAEAVLEESGSGHKYFSNGFCSVKIKVAPKLVYENSKDEDSNHRVEQINKTFKQISFESLYNIFSRRNRNNVKILPIYTPEEIAWRKNNKNIRVSCIGNANNIESWDHGHAIGVVPDILRYILKSSDIRIEFIKLSNNSDGVEPLKNGIVDMLSFSNDPSKEGFIYSLPYLEIPVVALSLNNTKSVRDTQNVIAVPSCYMGYYYYIKNKYTGNTVILVDTPDEAIKLVNNNIADIAILSKLNADSYIEKKAFSSLHMEVDYSTVFGFSATLLDNPDNRLLLGIINKSIIVTPKEIINSYLSKYYVKDKIEMSFYEAILFIGPWIIGAIAIILALWGYTTKKALVKLHKSEDSLQKEKSWLSATMRSIGEGVIATDVLGKIVQMNIVAEELTQCRESQAVGKFTGEVYSLYNSAFLTKERDPVEIALHEQEVVDLQNNIKLRTSVGTEIPITATAAPILDSANGELIGAVLVFKDVRAEAIFRQQLSQTKAMLSDAIELAGVSYFTYDISTGKVVISSSKKNSHLHIDSGKLSVRDILPDILEEDLVKINKSWKELLELKTKKFRANYRIKQDGKIRFKRVDVRSEVDSNNKIVRAFGVRLDVTDIIAAEKKARERLDQAYDLAKLLYYEYHPLTDTMVSNDKLNEVFMISPVNSNKVSIKEMFQNVVDEDKEKIRGYLFETKNNRLAAFEQEVRVVKRGKQNVLKVFVNNSFLDDGQWVGSAGCVLDITELNYVQKELAISEEQKRLILGSIKESVVYINRELEIVWANESTYTVFECEELKALSIQYNNIVYGESTPSMECNTVKVIRGVSDILIESLSYKGKELHVSLNPIRDRVGNVTHVVKTFSDVSEFKEIQNNLKEAYERAETANKAKSTFLSTMTHEIRTPLNAIIGFSGLLQYEKLDVASSSYARSINTAATGLLSLINNVLDFSRLEANKLTLNLEAVNLNELIRDVEVLFAEKAKSKGIVFAISIDVSMPLLILDKDRLRQVFINLIGNAIKFTNSGSVNVRIEFTALDGKMNESLRVSVEDTGIGIPLEDQSRIFESFEQHESGSKRKYEGTGLGLSISKRIVELMNGEIVLTSQVGVGSEFTVLLRDVQRANSVIIESENETKSLSVFEEESVLLVSQNQNDLTVVTSLLHRMGLRCETMSSISDVSEIITEKEFKLIITSVFDVNKENKSFCEQIFSNAGVERIPVIAITGYSDPDEYFDTSEFAAVVIKPITIEGFSEVIGRFFVQVEELTLMNEVLDNQNSGVDDLAPEVIKEVMDRFSDKFEDLKHGIILDEAKEISEELIAFAINNGDQVLINIAKKLDQYIATYKLPDMMYIVKLFLKYKD